MSQTDPTVYPQGGEGPGEGATGTPPPGADDALKKENADLRAKNRELQAQALGSTHGLTPTQIELIAAQPLDKQGEYATKLADEAKAAAPPPAVPSGEPQPGQAPPAQPPSAGPPVDAPPTATQAAQDAMTGGGEAPYPVPPKGADPIETRILGAIEKNPPQQAWEEIKRIQFEEQRRVLEAEGTGT